MTNDVEHLCMHFPAIGAPYLLKCVFSHILCSVSSHKTFDYEVNNNSFYPFVFFGGSSICNSFTCISGPVGLGDWCFRGQ